MELNYLSLSIVQLKWNRNRSCVVFPLTNIAKAINCISNPKLFTDKFCDEYKKNESKCQLILARKSTETKMFKIILNLIVLSFTTIQGYSVQPRIINGILSKPSDFPFFVHISFEDSRCSATLISDRFSKFIFWEKSRNKSIGYEKHFSLQMDFNRCSLFKRQANVYGRPWNWW